MRNYPFPNLKMILATSDSSNFLNFHNPPICEIRPPRFRTLDIFSLQSIQWISTLSMPPILPMPNLTSPVNLIIITTIVVVILVVTTAFIIFYLFIFMHLKFRLICTEVSVYNTQPNVRALRLLIKIWILMMIVVITYHHHHHHVFCPRAGSSLQTQELRLQLY